MSEWTANDYRRAMNGLIQDAGLHKAAPGNWVTFLRESVEADIERLEKEILTLRALHDPRQQERFNLAAGEIAGLARFLAEDFGIGPKLQAKIEEHSNPL
jgi:hypothetical protein